MAAKRPPLPVILVANDLLDGDVVFRTAKGTWSLDPADALVGQDDATAEALEGEAQAAVARCEVIDAYLVDVELGPGGRPVPRHYRERIKTLGPSHRPDLGKQAELRK